MPDIRHVVIHSPGPNWQPGVPMFEQPGVRAHVDYFRTLLATGKLELGGPFLDEAGGGMMIPVAGISEAEITAFAMADPTVVSGLLKAEVRQWMVGMQRQPAAGG